MQQAEEPELVSAFPAPPAFFNLYTDGPDAGPTPPPPLKPTYHSFGTPYSTEDTVPDLLPEDMKIYPKDYNVKDEMKKVNRSLMYSFLELVDVLILNPTKFNAKLDDIEQLFLNMHNLINAYRPHQARETLIDLLKQQIQGRREATAEIRQIAQHAKDAVQTAHAALDTSQDAKADDPMDGSTLATPSSSTASSAATPGSTEVTPEEAADVAAAAARDEAVRAHAAPTAQIGVSDQDNMSSNKSRTGADGGVREPLLPLGANTKTPPYGSPANTRDAYARKLGYVPLIFQRVVNFVTTPRKMDRATTHGEAEASSFPHHQQGPSTSSPFIPPPGSIRGSIFNLMGATLGAGALSLPYAVAVSGVGFALLQLFLAAYLTIYSISLLMRAGDITKLKSYEDLAMYCFGKRAELFVEVCIMVFSFGIAVAYLVTLGDLITPLGVLVFGPNSLWSTRWFLMSLFCAFIMWPLSLLKDVSSLQFSSMLGVFSIIFLVIAVSIRSGMHIQEGGLPASLDWGMNLSHGPNFMLSVPIVMFAFTNQPNVFSIFTELQRPCIRRMSKVVDRAAYASLAIYLTIGLVAYIAFGHALADPAVKGNILLSFPMSDVLIAFARAAITFTVAVAYPLNIFPCRFSIDMMFFAQAKESLVRHVVVSTGLVIASLVLAIFCPNINVIFGIIGGTCSSVVCFCFPAAFVLKLEPGPICSRAKLGPLILFIGSAVIGAVSTGVTVWSNFYAN